MVYVLGIFAACSLLLIGLYRNCRQWDERLSMDVTRRATDLCILAAHKRDQRDAINEELGRMADELRELFEYEPDTREGDTLENVVLNGESLDTALRKIMSWKK